MIENDEMRMNDWRSAGCTSQLEAGGGRFYVYIDGLFSWYVAKIRKIQNVAKCFSCFFICKVSVVSNMCDVSMEFSHEFLVGWQAE